MYEFNILTKDHGNRYLLQPMHYCVFGTHCCQMTTEQNSASDNNAYATALMSREKHMNFE